MSLIINYNDEQHRKDVVILWESIFNYTDRRNSPEFVIDKKLNVNDDLFFVAIEKGKVIGTIMAGYDGHRGWIYSLAVIPRIKKSKYRH